MKELCLQLQKYPARSIYIATTNQSEIIEQIYERAEEIRKEEADFKPILLVQLAEKYEQSRNWEKRLSYACLKKNAEWLEQIAKDREARDVNSEAFSKLVDTPTSNIELERAAAPAKRQRSVVD